MLPGTTAGSPVPLLSILIPVYNVGEFLEPCLDSILAQISDDRVEVRIVDDASNDGSRELLAKIAQKPGNRVSVHFRETNGGIGVARNDLLMHAKGKYFWFIDPDDILLPDGLGNMIEVLETYSPDMLIFDYQKKGRLVPGFLGSEERLIDDRDALVRGIFASRMLHAWLRITHRRLWEQGLSFPAIRTFEDVATTPILALRANTFYYRPLPVIEYRFRRGSLLESVRGGRFDKKKHDDFLVALSSLKSEIENHLPDIGNKTRFVVAHFITREFTKICHRVIRSSFKRPDLRPIRFHMRHYRTELERLTLVPFRVMPGLYWKHGMLVQSFLVRYYEIWTRGAGKL